MSSKFVFFISLFIISIQLFCQETPTITKKQVDNMEWKMRNMTSLGAEAGMVQLRGGNKTESLWIGKYVDIGGIFTIGYMNGQGSYDDSSRTVQCDGKIVFGGAQLSYPIFKSNVFDIAPFWGIGVEYNSMQNIRKYNDQNPERQFETSGIGGYLSAGVGVTLGPFMVKAKVTGMTTANFNHANMIKATQFYPSVSIGLKPGRMLMNPYLFTADGLHYREEITDETITREYVNSTTDKLTYTATVKTTFSQGSVSVMDVRPYFFLGPQYLSGNEASSFGKSAFYGVVGGFRIGSFYMDGSYSQGDMPFRDPIKEYGFVDVTSPDYGTSRMDGYFEKSSRYGSKIGVDLVTWFAKSSFIPYNGSDAHRLKQATSYYAVIASFGMGKMNLGKINFYSPGGDSAYVAYQTRNGLPANFNAISPEPMNQSRSLNYVSIGGQFMLGTIGLDLDYYFVKKNGHYTKFGKEVGVSWKIPIVRLFRIGQVMRLEKKKGLR